MHGALCNYMTHVWVIIVPSRVKIELFFMLRLLIRAVWYTLTDEFLKEAGRFPETSKNIYHLRRVIFHNINIARFAINLE
jgi:hypothetical protein